jgi:uncharacterized protein
VTSVKNARLVRAFLRASFMLAVPLQSGKSMFSQFRAGAFGLACKGLVQLLAVSALLCPLCTWAEEDPQINLQRVKLSAGMHLIDAQVASSPEQRQTGLMFRKEMPQQEGMIFVFEQASQQCFWMKNTLLPLTAAFVADDGTIVNMADMKPQTTEPHCSAEPVRFVLEMNKGWFAKKGIKAGSKLGGPLFEARR